MLPRSEAAVSLNSGVPRAAPASFLSRVTGHASRLVLLRLRSRQPTTPTNALPMNSIEKGSGTT